MQITIKNPAETELLKRLLYTELRNIHVLQEHALSHGDYYSHPDYKLVNALLTELERAILDAHE